MKQAKVLTEKELKKVVDYINGMDRHAVRNRTMLLLTHYCGMRVNEIANLKKSVKLKALYFLKSQQSYSY